MGRQERTPTGEAATEFILSTFRANGLLLDAGDLLSADEGLTSSRWQVLGAIALAERPITVPQIARRMGLTRQSVHATVDRLVRDGLLELASNADHRRSALVRLTKRGITTYDAIDARQVAWVNRLARGIARSEIDTAVRVLEEISRRLEDDRGDAEHGDRTARAFKGAKARRKTGRVEAMNEVRRRSSAVPDRNAGGSERVP
jgi:DNA-binding MarR family transcriptional regulator